jgi:hypothetical protein
VQDHLARASRWLRGPLAACDRRERARFFFALLGAIFAGAGVIAVNEPAGPRTRRFAPVAGLICATVPALTLVLILRASQSGE